MKAARKQTCGKKTHRWTCDGGRRCCVCGQKWTKMPQQPKLVRLRYGSAYCELCRETIEVGELVGWWWVHGRGGRRKTAYCATCHHENVRHGKALQ